MATVFAFPVTLIGWVYADQIVPLFLEDQTTIVLAVEYTSIVFISLLFSVYSFVFVGFYTGVEKTKIHMTVTIVSNIINLYLNAALIYGSEGVDLFFREVLPSLSFLTRVYVFK